MCNSKKADASLSRFSFFPSYPLFLSASPNVKPFLSVDFNIADLSNLPEITPDAINEGSNLAPSSFVIFATTTGTCGVIPFSTIVLTTSRPVSTPSTPSNRPPFRSEERRVGKEGRCGRRTQKKQEKHVRHG